MHIGESGITASRAGSSRLSRYVSGDQHKRETPTAFPASLLVTISHPVSKEEGRAGADENPHLLVLGKVPAMALSASKDRVCRNTLCTQMLSFSATLFLTTGW